MFYVFPEADIAVSLSVGETVGIALQTLAEDLGSLSPRPELEMGKV